MCYRTIAICASLMFCFCSFAKSGSPERYSQFRLGEITAKGWIYHQMVRDMKEGNLASLNQIRKMGAPFAEKNGRGYGEFEGNYIDAIIRNAIVAGYEPFLDWADEISEKILAGRTVSGFMGGKAPSDFEEARSREIFLWSQACFLRGLLAYAEFTGNPRYLDAVVDDVDYVMSLFDEGDNFFNGESSVEGGARAHGLMFVDVLEGLHVLTGDKRYLDFAERLYEDYSSGINLKNNDNQKVYLTQKERPFLYHAPHIAEHSRVLYYLAAHSDEYLKLAENSLFKLRQALSPSGGLITDPFLLECVGGNYGDPDLRYEYCSLTETAVSLESCFRKFGDPEIAEIVENIVFNAAQAARFSDGKACAYCSKDNQLLASGDEKDHTFRHQYAACHKIACCVFNQSRIMPYYVHNMWLRSQDGGILAAYYGPSLLSTEISGHKFGILEETMYPFENTIRFTVSTDKALKVPLRFRIPSWCKGFEIKLNGRSVSSSELRENILSLERKWSDGDMVELSFDSEVEIHSAYNNEFYFTKGALLFARRFEEKKIPVKSFADSQLKNYNIVPADPTDSLLYENLVLERGIRNKYDTDKSFTRFEYVEYQNKDYPYDEPYSTISVVMYDGKKKSMQTLVPIGSTILRRTTFKDQSDK